MTKSIENKEVGVFAVTNKSISLATPLVITLAEAVVSPFEHGIFRNNALNFSLRGEYMLIGMTTDVSKYQLTQNNTFEVPVNQHVRCLQFEKVFEYALSPVKMIAKSDGSHNMETSGYHTYYIILQKLSIIKHF